MSSENQLQLYFFAIVLSIYITVVLKRTNYNEFLQNFLLFLHALRLPIHFADFSLLLQGIQWLFIPAVFLQCPFMLNENLGIDCGTAAGVCVLTECTQ